MNMMNFPDLPKVDQKFVEKLIKDSVVLAVDLVLVVDPALVVEPVLVVEPILVPQNQ